MRMNHINLAVSDVPESKAFLETYFGLRCLASQDPDKLVVLSDESDCVVTLSHLNKTDEVIYPKAFHVGFMQPSREAVDALYERLRGDGHDTGPRKMFHGAWTFYFEAPGGFRVEVGCQLEMA